MMKKRIKWISILLIWMGWAISDYNSAFPQDSLSVNTDASEKQFGIKYWWEVYNETMKLQRDNNNFNSLSHTRQGLKFPLSSKLSIETYFFIRYGKDLHKDFWNNKFEGGLGIRARYSKKVFLAFFLETIRGTYLNTQEAVIRPPSDAYTDFRSGFIFWYGWDKYPSTSQLYSFPLSSWGDIYSDIIYYQKENNNVIGYFQARSGFRLLQFWKCTLDSYGIVYVIKDINKDFWNNLVEAGPGFWLKPHPDLDLKFFVEWLYGTYLGIEGRDLNPYAQHYRDRRIGILFWIGW